MSGASGTATSPFVTLLRKDARLSLDVVRPWLVALVAGGLLLVGITRLPESLVGSVSQVSLSDLLRLLGTALAATAAPVAILISASIVHGDRVHGASTLAAVLPRGRIERGLSATAMALAGSALVGVVAIVLFVAASATRPMGMPVRISLEIPWFGVATALAGGGVGFWIARHLRQRWHAALIGCAILALAAATVGGVARWMLPSLLPGLFALLNEGDIVYHHSSHHRGDLLSIATTTGAIVAVLGSGTIGWISGAAAMIGGTRRARLLPWVIGLPLVVLVALVAVRVVVRGEAIQRVMGYPALIVADLSTTEAVAIVERHLRTRGSSARTPEGELAAAVVLRVASLPDEERQAHPVTQWLDARRLEDATTARFAILARPPTDPGRFRYAIETMARFPPAPDLRSVVLDALDERWRIRLESAASSAQYELRVIELLVGGLERILADPNSTLPPPSWPLEAPPIPVDAATREAISAVLPGLRQELDRLRLRTRLNAPTSTGED